ncbi:MAG: DUF3267 domain-containing protein [Saprospiraceae bacterium]
MNPKIEQDLIEQGYYVSERWKISSVLGFIRQELSNKGAWLLGFQALLFILVGLGLYMGYRDISGGAKWFSEMAIPFSLGLLAMLLVVVPHELLHGIAYRWTGAKKVIYGADWKRMVFHASAPYHPINYKQMLLVALTPFVVLTSLLLIGLVLTTGPYWWFFFGLLLMHTQGCFGDFAMVNFFARQARPERWITFDDSKEETFVLLTKEF